MATRKAAKRTTARKSSAKARAPKRKGARKKPAKKAARPKTPGPEALARKIVRVTQDFSKLVVEDLYTEDCMSWEPGGGEPALGHEGIRGKNEYWEGLQQTSKAVWTARNIFTKRNAICIEWQADLVMRDGRSVRFEEVAVHELKGGKILKERYYYDASALAPPVARPEPPRQPERAAPVVVATPAPERVETQPAPTRVTSLPELDDDTDPDLDPIDL